MVERLAPVAVRTTAVIRKSGLWDLALIVVAFVLYYLVRGAVALLGLLLVVLLDLYGGRIWARVAPERFHRARTWPQSAAYILVSRV